LHAFLKTFALDNGKMYRNDSLTPIFPEFGLPFGGYLDPDNRWVKKATMIPWAVVEREYKNQLSGSTTGCPALTARMAFGALVIKEELKASDRETVEQIRENPYLQFFIGLEGFQTKEPFDASMMVHFRKRFPVESMNRINEAMTVAAAKPQKEKSSDKDGDAPKDSMTSSDESTSDENIDEAAEDENRGKLLIDATCTPADIRYPTDLNLLNEAREKTEAIIDRLHKECPDESKKPRTYRKKARKEYLAVAKKKSKSFKVIRKAIRKQLGYVGRNLAHIKTLAQTVSLGVLKRNLYRSLLVISELHRQQKIMYDSKQKRIADRIVSIWFPQIRPIKRGKANAETEFGAKLNLSLVNGFAFMERIDWSNFNESTDLIQTIKNFHHRFGFFPESVHVDKIYRNKDNRNYCKKYGIRISGPAMGRPVKDEIMRRERKQLARQDEIDRVPIEGKFGEGKRRFGLARIMAKLAETSLTVIGINLFVMNLHKISRLCNLNQFFLFIDLWIEGINKALQAIIKAKWRRCTNFF
jgi:transposase, IS5 family